MRFSAALLVGLGARIFLDIAIRPPPELSRRDAILTGIWQGVALYHTYSHHLEFLFLVSFAISAWLMIDFALIHDVNRMTTILLGVALGIFCAGLLSQFEGDHRSGKRRDAKVQSPSKKNRLAQLYKDTRGERSRRPRVPTMSDITAPSLDTSSDTLDPKSNMTPIEREIASLRTRASLADTERRRYKEEKKWALSQGNIARAEQMRWQVKRYTTLVHSFNREADARLLEASNSRQTNGQQQPPASSSRTRSRKLSGNVSNRLPSIATNGQPATLRVNGHAANIQLPSPNSSSRRNERSTHKISSS